MIQKKGPLRNDREPVPRNKVSPRRDILEKQQKKGGGLEGTVEGDNI
jgi:hypothetical protein